MDAPHLISGLSIHQVFLILTYFSLSIFGISMAGKKTIACSKGETVLPLGKILLSDEHGVSSVKFCASYRHAINTDRESMVEETETTPLFFFFMFMWETMTVEISHASAKIISHENKYNQYK